MGGSLGAPTVAIVYSGIGDTSIEEAALTAVDARIVYAESLDAPEVRAADAVMVTTQTVTAAVLGTLERCRIVSRVGVGLDNIDIPAATARGIWVTNVPDYAIDEVSMHAIALMLAHLRRVPDWGAMTRRGEWNGASASAMRRPGSLTLGVLGFGRIGSAAAAKGRGLGLRVIAHDPYIDARIIRAAGVEPVEWETLLRRSDYLSLHVPLTDGTAKIIDAAALSLMQPHAYLINTARGGVVDEDALLAALQQGGIAGAALDVLATEPPRPEHPLLCDARVTVTPHVAWGSDEASRDVRAKGTDEVVRVLRGDRPRCPANEVVS
jgi:D-3-phosphoglycerate dehydrogenase / 2-oxoglutarate reductase